MVEGAEAEGVERWGRFTVGALRASGCRAPVVAAREEQPVARGAERRHASAGCAHESDGAIIVDDAWQLIVLHCNKKAQARERLCAHLAAALRQRPEGWQRKLPPCRRAKRA